MEIIKEIVLKYWYLAASLITLIGIFKFAIHASSKGLRAAFSQMIAFVLIVVVLVTAAGPFLNWTFKTTVLHVGDNLIVQSGLTLTSQTIDLIKNAEISGEPMSLDVTQEEFNKALEETQGKAEEAKDKVEEAATNVMEEAGIGSSEKVNDVAAPAATPVAKPAVAPVPTVSAQEILSMVKGEPTSAPLTGQEYIDTFLKEQKAQQAQEALEAVNSLGGGGPIKTYIVVKGDTLSTIASKFDVSLTQLCAINNIKNCNVIHRGMVLVLP